MILGSANSKNVGRLSNMRNYINALLIVSAFFSYSNLIIVSKNPHVSTETHN